MAINSSAEILQAGGLLSHNVKDFSVRDSQQKMAEAIELAIKQSSQLVVEAGTGTGKTFAYLTPAFISGKKILISTGTKNLQDQLFFHDIPILRKALALSARIVLLKGRSNYLCLERLQRTEEEGLLQSSQAVTHLSKIVAWASITTSGDVAEMNAVPEDSTVWPMVTSNTDNCLGIDCPLYEKCFVVKARQAALKADIIVVNHHIFFADMALQEEGFGELLPAFEVVIFDEAHQLPEIATQFFSETFTSRQLLDLAKDAEIECSQDAKEVMLEVSKIHLNLQQAILNMRLAFGFKLYRGSWQEKPTAIVPHIEIVQKYLEQLQEILKNMASRTKALEACSNRSIQLIALFSKVTANENKQFIHWFETHSKSFTIKLTPLMISNIFQEYLKTSKQAWIFTSATLTVENKFHLFLTSMGLDGAITMQLESPFDYPKQALLYVPRYMPDPQNENYTEAVINAALPVLEASRGRAFILFTSYKALEFAASILSKQINYPILVQGEMPKLALLEKFRQLGNAILLGTGSFWQGVDVRGEALSCVIIDKLPFAAPDDPILQARSQAIRQQGIDPFTYYHLPNAVLILKQGAGRLIRDIEDKGILMVCDPRMVANRYGKVFLQSLPPMTRTRDLTKVKTFLQGL